MYYKPLYLLIFIQLTLCSCQKIIDIDLNEGNTKYVVSAAIEEGSHTAVLNITETIGYFDTVYPPKISGAESYIMDNNNNINYFQEKKPGIYLIHNFEAIPNNTYNINIQIENETITGSSFLPPFIILDSLTYTYESPSIISNGGYIVYAEFNDPIEQDNYYRLRVTKNGELNDKPRQMVLFNDKFSNGSHIKIPYYLNSYDLGDEIKLELISIDKDVYRYYETLFDATVYSGPNDAAPSNPESNLSDNAIGYFGLYSVSSKTILIQ